MDKKSVYSSAEPAPIAILGVPFDNVSTEQTISLIQRMIASGRPHYLATANVDFLVQASQDVELRRILFDAHLVLCDGTPLVWASKLLGNPLPERVAGSDLVPLLLKVAAEKGYRPFFLGSTPSVAEQAAAKLKERFPTLNVAGFYAPPFNKLLDMDHDEISRRIADAKPDMLFVGFGCPKQEKWIAMHYRTLGVPVAVGVGATIDFLAGKVARAPRWMQKTGTEWIFRLLQEPRRLFRRYFVGLWHFSGAILKQYAYLRSRRRHKAVPPPVPVIDKTSWKLIEAPKRLDIESVHREKSVWEEALASHPHCFLNLNQVEFIDSTGVGLLIRLQKQARQSNQQFVLLGVSDVVQRALSMMRLQDFFISVPDIAAAERLVSDHGTAQAVAVKNSSFAARPALFWQGEVTAANADAVWENTKSHIISSGTAQGELVVDLSALRFIDSTGLSLMIRARKFALQQGITVRFVAIQPAVLNVLRLARLEDYLLSAKS
ncbi:MAG: Anti-sigma-factor antagonist and glycosyl transferase [Verrucomicrobiales bacterium]|nr:Anti-sigma-factor antagonist and glycosyl transferase [Verrucomicrobiales bacterium]